MIKKIAKRFLVLYVPLMIFLVYVLFPFFWNLVTSLKSNKEILKRPISYLPKTITFENYVNIWTNVGYYKYFINSLVVAAVTLLFLMAVSVLGGYAISRFQFKGKKFIMLIFLLTQMLPGVVLLIPLFTIFRFFYLSNTLIALIITYTTINVPYCTFMVSGFFSSISPHLEEAAMVDGCSTIGAICRILLPAIAPGLVATGAFGFVNSWNDFIYAIAFISDNKKFTLPVGLSFMKGEFSVDYGGIAAGSIIALIPVMIMFAYIQKYLVGGLTAGAVKG